METKIKFKKVRKKPIKVKAVQMDAEFVMSVYRKQIINENLEVRKEDNKLILFVKTLEGEMKTNLYDYLICGINGELYSCDCDIFYKTYDFE